MKATMCLCDCVTHWFTGMWFIGPPYVK